VRHQQLDYWPVAVATGLLRPHQIWHTQKVEFGAVFIRESCASFPKLSKACKQPQLGHQVHAQVFDPRRVTSEVDRVTAIEELGIEGGTAMGSAASSFKAARSRSMFAGSESSARSTSLLTCAAP
jgi:hypothetical protein